MGRVHLFEFNDQPWLPEPIRRMMTDFLGFIANVTEMPYRAIIDRLSRALAATGQSTIVDLCSGGGGPAPKIASMLARAGQRLDRVVLTDLFPNNPQLERLELTDRSIPSLIGALLSPLTIWLTTPFIRPFSILRLLFTYVVPIVPLLSVWDGVVSCLRVYSPRELEALTKDLDDFIWDIGRARAEGAPAYTTYLIGYPRSG